MSSQPVQTVRSNVAVQQQHPPHLQHPPRSTSTPPPPSPPAPFPSGHNGTGHSAAAAHILKTIHGNLRVVAGSPSPPVVFRKSHQSKPRSHAVKGAALQLPKETKLLRQRLDRVVEGFQHSITEYEKVQKHRLRKLAIENGHLHRQVRDLEVESLKLSSDLLDEEEIITELKTERQELIEEVHFMKSAVKERRQQEAALEARLEAEKAQLMEQNTALIKEVEELTNRSEQQQDRMQELEVAMEQLQADLAGKENDSLLVATRRSTRGAAKNMINMGPYSPLSRSGGVDDEIQGGQQPFHRMTLRRRRGKKQRATR